LKRILKTGRFVFIRLILNAEITINQGFPRLFGDKKKKKLTDTGLYGFSRIWKILLDGKFGHWMVWVRNAINQLSKSNVHLTKSLNQSSIAQFQLFGNYLIHRKIAIL
jgi:hypothetical protein